MIALRRIHGLWLLLAIILLLRLLALGSYPLLDTSEARYGEMARKMVESGDWITPMFDYQRPFWGKPPLSFWTQALSMQVLGVTEFAARLPAWFFHLGSCLLLIRLGSRERSSEVGLWAAIIYSSSGLGVIASGAVLTDPALAFAVLLACYGFWNGMQHGERGSALLGFVGLGLGLLAKGPLVILLLAVPALAWTTAYRQWRQLWQLPWGAGLTLMVLLALPWYVLAEGKTPGFLDYFLVGEHWNRYIVSGWAGDLYGTAHAKAYGTIWLYLIYALVPWSLLLPLLWWRRETLDRFQAFLWVWALTAPVFFTLAGNILWTYLLPALPAWSLLLARALVPLRWPGAAWAGALALPIGGLVIVTTGMLQSRVQNQRDIVQAWQAEQGVAPGPLLYPGRRSYSAEFYSRGQASHLSANDDYPAAGTFYLSRRLRNQQAPLAQGIRCSPVVQANASELLRCQHRGGQLSHE